VQAWGVMRQIKWRRIAAFTMCLLAVSFVVCIVSAFFFDTVYSNEPVNAPEAIGDGIFRVILLPAIVVTKIYGQRVPVVLLLPLWIASGLFRGFVIELIFIVTIRKRHRSLEPN
jgi:hypothetical protein